MSKNISLMNQIYNKPQKPQVPTTPPGGNIENRQAPSEPSKPIEINNTIKTANSLLENGNSKSSTIFDKYV